MLLIQSCSIYLMLSLKLAVRPAFEPTVTPTFGGDGRYQIQLQFYKSLQLQFYKKKWLHI